MTEKEKSNDPIVIEGTGMRRTVVYRHTGGDEGLTFDITTAGEKEGGARMLRFDCFKKTPHYHVGPSGKCPVHDMKEEGIEDPLRWTLEQIKTRLPSMVAEAGYEELAGKIDQKAVADRLSRIEKDLFAKI